MCGLGNNWNGKPLVLILDHINGIYNDNRIENLRLLCPNCNSQTDTFAGRNCKKAQKYYCPDCGKEKLKTSKRCYKCAVRENYNSKRPTKEELQREMLENSIVNIAKKHGVHRVTVHSWIREYNK